MGRWNEVNVLSSFSNDIKFANQNPKCRTGAINRLATEAMKLDALDLPSGIIIISILNKEKEVKIKKFESFRRYHQVHVRGV